ncbi:unnamed protein product [Dicrocoelium dendriticum]|nr:unnamed protein product [Dicrocoelium dendriticum]
MLRLFGHIKKPVVSVLNRIRSPLLGSASVNVMSLRLSSNQRVMVPKASDFMDGKLFDSIHFFIMLGAIPCFLLVFCVNVLVGRAELSDIPEGYEPRHWEYHKHPLTRFIARYIAPHPQQVYESKLGLLADLQDQRQLVEEERWFRESQRIHGDYRGWYFVPANPAGVNRGLSELELDQEMGDLISR